MDNSSLGHQIVLRENEPSSLLRLRAQKALYYRAKIWAVGQIWTTVVAIVLLTIASLWLKAMYDIDIEWIVSGYAVFIAVLDVAYINEKINALKSKASMIQELFDSYVFGIPLNTNLHKRVPPELIHASAQKVLEEEKIEKLKNWYDPGVSSISNTVSILICQRSNLVYDSSLRSKFLKLIIWLTSLFFIFLIVFSLLRDVSVRSLILSGLVPFLPMFQVSLRAINANRASIKSVERIRNKIMQLWDMSLNGDTPTIEQLRGLQDQILLHRERTPLIPEWYYNRRRNRLEEQMYYSVNQLTEEYNNVK